MSRETSMKSETDRQAELLSLQAFYLRQLPFLDPQLLRDLRIGLVGCGGLGSVIGLALTKMGARHWVLFDGEVLKIHNLPTHLYPAPWYQQHLHELQLIEPTMTKTDWLALSMRSQVAEPLEIHTYGHYSINSIPFPSEEERFDSCSAVILAVDDPNVCRFFYKRMNLHHQAFFHAWADGLLVGCCSLLPDPPRDVQEAYQRYLDSEKREAISTDTGIVCASLAAGALVAALIRSWLQKRAVPWLVSLDLASYQMHQSYSEEQVSTNGE